MKRVPAVIDANTQEFIEKPKPAKPIRYGGGWGGGKRAFMEANMRDYVARNPGATIVIMSADTTECRVEKPATEIKEVT